MRIADLIEHERPRERCLRVGAHDLSLRECLAVLLGTGPRARGSMGTAQMLIERLSSSPVNSAQETAFFTVMSSQAVSFLESIPGIGKAGMARILVAFELARRYRNQFDSCRPSTVTADSLERRALAKVNSYWRNHAHEWIGFVPILPNATVCDLYVVEKGAKSHVSFRIQEFFAQLLVLRPRAFVLIHNHPSGNLRPSKTDYELTDKLRTVAENLEIELLSHWIVSGQHEQQIMF